MPLEVERKYLNVDLAAMSEKLSCLGWHSSGWHFETNLVFDFPDRSLVESGKLLRLRLNEWPHASQCVLTLKLPSRNTPTSSNGKPLKSREELEVLAGSFDSLKNMLLNLGYMIIGKYEKVRESWRQLSKQSPTIEVDLDWLPFCRVVEIEGASDDIDRTALLLGLDKFPISAKTYYELNQEWRSSRGLPQLTDFVFEDDQKIALKHQFGL